MALAIVVSNESIWQIDTANDSESLHLDQRYPDSAQSQRGHKDRIRLRRRDPWQTGGQGEAIYKELRLGYLFLYMHYNGW
jgi:hypothetical protein